MKRWVKISIIVAIALVVVGIFSIKMAQQNSDVPQDAVTQPDSTATQKPSGTVETEQEDVSAERYPLQITKADLNAIKAYGVPTVIDFGSDSCIPCKEMAPVLKTLNAEWQDRAAVQFIDVWEYTNGVEDFPVSVIPTQIFFNADGSPYVPSEEIQKEIEFIMYENKETDEHVFTAHQGGITEEQMRAIFAEMGIK
ncbi:MAG: thioredoxin family protein [Clostridia bacterium]